MRLRGNYCNKSDDRITETVAMTTVAQITEFASQVNKTYLMLRASGMSLQKGRRLRMGGIWQ